ncbi:MAG: pyrimidine-nucleoside phosphorylase [Gemmatimonas sp. SG8_28]|jgi:pyrimidine-nucleoside phosphorylase|nr:MAG: pyrimidine-nucleoside phosphorylase [Gemmatimonas sp. SG8_28]
MIVIPLIERKRDGGCLSPSEWRDVVLAYARDEVPDYQMAALLMATRMNGLASDELAAVTEAMLDSGARLTFDSGAPRKVDKHSTGGVGDKVSLVLAPLVAACGLAVPMISGRGLGHTGGTLDKLQAIPGFRTDLTLAEARAQVERIGVALMGQTDEIAPADRKLYALRDATATIDAIPLMAASIMSKKLAEGLDGLVLDIKRGSGAFLPRLVDGLELARTMVALGTDHGCRTVALLTAMDRPLGRACGNALEVVEAVEALHGRGPSDLMDLVLALGIEMLVLGEAASDDETARRLLDDAVASGRAFAKFREIVATQGGEVDAIDDLRGLPAAPVIEAIAAATDGVVTAVEPRSIGRAVVAMGGGRQSMQDGIDPAVGIVVSVAPGDAVERGAPLATVHARDAATLALGRRAVEDAVRIGPILDEPPLPLVSHRVTADGVYVVGGG